MDEAPYIIFGSEYSPFSVKLRSYFRYKDIPHEWRPRTLDNQEEFKALAKLPLIPLVQGPDNEVMQDSTPIIERMEARFPDRPIQPPSSMLAYLSSLLEDYADEWVNKPMFHYRWWRDEDQIAVSDGLARAILPNGERAAQDALATQLRARMVPRLSFVGSHEGTKDIIEASFMELIALLETHLAGRAYLFGGQPSLADFGLFGQIYCCLQQPTTEKILREAHPRLIDWIDLMLSPERKGDWESWDMLAPTLEPVLKNQVGAIYLPWSAANAKAVTEDAGDFTALIKGAKFSQQTVKYSAKALQTLKTRLATLEERGDLDDILLKTGCLQPLVSESW